MNSLYHKYVDLSQQRDVVFEDFIKLTLDIMLEASTDEVKEIQKILECYSYIKTFVELETLVQRRMAPLVKIKEYFDNARII